jgi:Cu(I)/Ag(I) efflux system membrane fusion protein
VKKIFQNRIIQFFLVLITGLLLGKLIFDSKHDAEQKQGEVQSQETTYTCSMHPQIRQNTPGNCPICGMELIPVSKQGKKNGQKSQFVHQMSPDAIALANIQTQKVELVSSGHEVSLTGKIVINEQNLAVISANYSGRIEKLFVDFTGQAVTKGQKLATIYSPELVTAQKELMEAAKYKNENPSLYNAAKGKLRLWKITENQIDNIENSGAVLTELDIYADLSGVVVKREVSKGDYVDRGRTLFEIANLSNVWVILDAYESDLSFIRKGQKITFTLISVPGKEFSATVTFIDPLINPQTRTASIRAEVVNRGLILKPEMFVKATIRSGYVGKKKSLVVPKTALLWTGKRSLVYVKVQESEYPAFEMREIALGGSMGDSYIVEKGLNEGEEIVVNGVFAIDAAAQLNGNYSMMNRPVSKRITVPDEFKNQLTTAVNQYFILKNDLVKSDFDKARKNGLKLLSSLNQVDMKLLDDDAHIIWMKQQDSLEKYVDQLSKAANIDKQREYFAPLSNLLIEVADLFGLTLETAYVAFCPMAFDDKGAHWLSEFEDIKNPYFGDAMLQCGEVKKQIKSLDSYKENTKVSPSQEKHQH